MDKQLFESLLRKSESETLDFKVSQYPFEGASDDEKSELLKDILAFANAWRDGVAFILIGVDEVMGKTSTVVGVHRHLEDASLQEFVNKKTQAPIVFRYYPFTFESASCGVIEISLQKRPSFLRKSFGRLKPNVVYIRRGSSTDEADPDEIADMGRKSLVAPKPLFEVFAKPRFGDERGHPNMMIDTWLFNKGEGTADDIVVVIQKHPTGVLGLNYNNWDGHPSSHPGISLRLKHPLNPHDHVSLCSVNLGMATIEENKFSVGCEDIAFKLKVLARNQTPLDLSAEFDRGDIKPGVGAAFS